MAQIGAVLRRVAKRWVSSWSFLILNFDLDLNNLARQGFCVWRCVEYCGVASVVWSAEAVARYGKCYLNWYCHAARVGWRCRFIHDAIDHRLMAETRGNHLLLSRRKAFRSAILRCTRHGCPATHPKWISAHLSISQNSHCLAFGPGKLRQFNDVQCGNSLHFSPHMQSYVHICTLIFMCVRFGQLSCTLQAEVSCLGNIWQHQATAKFFLVLPAAWCGRAKKLTRQQKESRRRLRRSPERKPDSVLPNSRPWRDIMGANGCWCLISVGPGFYLVAHSKMFSSFLDISVRGQTLLNPCHITWFCSFCFRTSQEFPGPFQNIPDISRPIRNIQES